MHAAYYHAFFPVPCFRGHAPNRTTSYSPSVQMNTKMLGIVLIVLGALALAYGGFSYTKEETAFKVGSLELNVEEKKNVNVPMWAGIGAIVVGGVLVLTGKKN